MKGCEEDVSVDNTVLVNSNSSRADYTTIPVRFLASPMALTRLSLYTAVFIMLRPTSLVFARDLSWRN